MASSQPVETSSFNLMYIFQVIQRHVVYLSVVVGASVVLAFIFTLPFIYKPEFKSSAIVYPNAPERFDMVNLFHEEPILYLYGESKDVEKIEQIATHEEVKIMVMDSLDLWKAYGVDPINDESPKYYGFRTYDAMVKMTRVAGNGLEIEAYDTEPQRAADIVNLLIDITNERYKLMLNENKAPILEMYRNGYEKLEAELALYNDSLRRVRTRYNVLNTVTQTEKLVEQILEAESEYAEANAMYQAAVRSGSGASTLKQKVDITKARLNRLVNQSAGGSITLESFREGLDMVLTMEEMTQYLARDLKDSKEKIEALHAMLDTDYRTLMVSGKAAPSDKKARPIRWVILLATFLIAALVSVFSAVLIDRITTAANQESGRIQ